MQTTRIDYSNLVRQLLPAHKRQPVRLRWLRALTAPLAALFASFDQWRGHTRMLVNVTSQVAVFEGYLRRKYGRPVEIKIVTYDDGALMVGLEPEGDTQRIDIALDDTESRPTADLPLDGEIRERFGDADFIVYIPAGIDIDLIRAETERFKQALTQYRIIQQ